MISIDIKLFTWFQIARESLIEVVANKGANWLWKKSEAIWLNTYLFPFHRRFFIITYSWAKKKNSMWHFADCCRNCLFNIDQQSTVNNQHRHSGILKIESLLTQLIWIAVVAKQLHTLDSFSYSNSWLGNTGLVPGARCPVLILFSLLIR